jgi:hypothetical protein
MRKALTDRPVADVLSGKSPRRARAPMEHRRNRQFSRGNPLPASENTADHTDRRSSSLAVAHRTWAAQQAPGNPLHTNQGARNNPANPGQHWTIPDRNASSEAAYPTAAGVAQHTATASVAMIRAKSCAGRGQFKAVPKQRCDGGASRLRKRYPVHVTECLAPRSASVI